MTGEIKIYRLFITPQTHIRITKNERWLFAEGVSDTYLKEFGKRKYNERVARGVKNPGNPNDYFNRKNYIKQYFQYKRKLKELFDECGIGEFPKQNVWVKFFLPMPKSWSQKKKLTLNFELHTKKPDADNLYKALTDSILKEDKLVSDYRASKFWIDGTNGYIEIEVGALPPPIGYKKFEKPDKIK